MFPTTWPPTPYALQLTPLQASYISPYRLADASLEVRRAEDKDAVLPRTLTRESEVEKEEDGSRKEPTGGWQNRSNGRKAGKEQ